MHLWPKLKKKPQPLKISRSAKGKKKSVVHRKIVGWSLTTILVAVAVAIIAKGEKGLFKNGVSKVAGLFKKK